MKGIIPQGKPWTQNRFGGSIPPQGTGYGFLRPLALTRKWNQLVGSASLVRLRINLPTKLFYNYETT